MKSIKLIKVLMFGCFVFFTLAQASHTRADNPGIHCGISSSSTGLLQGATSILTPTADPQIFKDACGMPLAIMTSQLKTPTQNAEAIAASYGGTLTGQISARSKVGSSVPVLHSNPTATRKLYLDFDGYTFPTINKDSEWFGYFGGFAQPGAFVPGLDLDGNPNSFSQFEQDYITETWLSVAEDFSPFQIDVTTEDPGVNGLTRSNVNDLNFGVTAVVSSAANWSAKCNCGGVAYVASINVNPNSMSGTPNINPYGTYFNFNKFNNDSNYYATAKDLGGIISHESGHAVGLGHDGTNSVGYYGGHSNGIWAPIMGTSYGVAVNQWSKNEYTNGRLTSLQGYVDHISGYGWYWSGINAPELKDDFEVITLNNVPLKDDDYADNITNAYVLNRSRLTLSGIIGPNQDKDYFKFTVSAKQLVSVSATPIQKSPNLDIALKIYNSNGQVVDTFDPPIVRGDNAYPSGMDASFIRREFLPGSYYLSVEGSGWGNPLSTGYSNYGSVGQYTFDFTIHLTAQAPLRITNTNITPEVGQEVAVSTSGGSGNGNLTFAVTGSNCSISGDKLTVNASTSCSVIATKESDGVFSEVSSSPVVFNFKQAQQDLSISNTQLTNPVGTPVNILITGGSGNGAITLSLTTPNSLCRIRTNTLSASTPTTCSIVATKASEGVYASKTSSPKVFTFKGAQATLTVSNTTTSAAIGSEITLTSSGGSGSGAVSFLATGTGCQINSGKLSSDTATTCSVIATKESDNTYAVANSAPKIFTFLQGQADLAISNQLTTNPIDTQVTLTTSGGSGDGAVIYSLAVPNPLCSLIGDKLTASQPTQCSIVATKFSQGLFASKDSAAVVFSFKGPQATLRITNSALTNNVGTEIILTTSGGSGTGAVTFSKVGENCSINTNKLTASAGSSCVVTASKAADATFAPKSSSPITFIFLGEQTAISISNQVKTGTVGTPITLTTSGGSGSGVVSFRISTPNNACRISRSNLFATSGTTCEVIANKASQGLFQAATSNSVIFTFKGPQSELIISNQTTTNSVGNEVVLTTSGGSGTGEVTYQVTGSNCSIASGKLTATEATICSVVASKASDSTFSSISSAAKVFRFLTGQANLTISNLVTSFAVGTSVTLTAQGGSGLGAISFALATPNSLCALNGNTLIASQPTECSVKATKAAEGLYNSKDSIAKSFYFKGSQETLRITNSIRTVSVGIELPISTTGGSGTGNVSFNVTGTNCSINNGSLSATSGAICSVIATKAGDALYSATQSQAVSFTFLQDQAALSITNNVRTNVKSLTVTLTSSGGSGNGSITYLLSERNRSCRIDRDRLTALAPTTCKVVVIKAASGLYSAKQSAAVDFIFT